jgi:hypothetical protein
MLIMICSACTGISDRTAGRPAGAPPFDETRDTDQLLQTITRKNHALSAFKGIGKTEFILDDRVQVARVAWLGSRPSRLRLEILDPLGRSAVSLSTDGKTLYYASLAQNQFFKTDVADPDLKHLLALPIKVRDVIELLAGRIPIYPHDRIELIPSDSGYPYVLVLKRRWTGVCEKIYIDENKTRIYKIEIFQFPKGLMYRAAFNGSRFVDGFEIPSEIVVTNDKGAFFKLRIDTYFANVPVLASAFVLNHPFGD